MSLLYNPIALIFISYGIGAIVTGFLNSTGFICHFENRNFISNLWTKRLGVLLLGWLVKNSFMRLFNKNVYLNYKKDKASLEALTKEMTNAEVGHFIGFVFLLIVNIYMIYTGMGIVYILLFALINIVFNLYLVLLQQYNKRRINRLLSHM